MGRARNVWMVRAYGKGREKFFDEGGSSER